MFYMMEVFRKTISNVKGSVYQERIEQKTDYYNFIREMMDSYIN
jgi:hypothetical protein